MQPQRQNRLGTRATAELSVNSAYRALAHHAPVIITNTAGVIQHANKPYCTLSGYAEHELVGRTPRVLNSGHHPRTFFRNLWKTVAAGNVWQGEIRNRNADGSIFWIDATVVPFHNEADNATYFAAICTDTTLRREAEDGLRSFAHDLLQAKLALEQQSVELEAKNAELEIARQASDAASRAKSEFLANMSHEIRTPMTAILGYAQLLGRPTADDALRREAIETILRNGTHLISVINDILDLSKIEAGRMTIERTATDLHRLVADAVGLMQGRAQAKDLHLDLDIDPLTPKHIGSDPTRLRQILLNLLSNAIKFTERGGVRVDVAPTTATDDPAVQIAVTDTGVGLSPEQLEAVFESFKQADGSTTRRYGGTGLGLPISKKLANLLGGDLVGVSEPGVGSTFRATVLAPPPTDTPEPPQPAPEHCNTALAGGVRVLLAEDGPDNQRLLSHLLRGAGADVAVAPDGKDAVERALAAQRQGEPFDVILMDMLMPVVDGYSATTQLREAGYDGLIIALTANAMIGDRDKCLRAGCDDYATKPVNMTTLLAAIARGLGTRAHAPER